MTEGMPPTLEQSRQIHRSLTEKVLDKACSDPQWRQQLLDDPEEAMRAAGFPEAQQLQQIQASAQGSEVSGQWFPGGEEGGGGGHGGGGDWCRSWTWYCSWWTYRWERG